MKYFREIIVLIVLTASSSFSFGQGINCQGHLPTDYSKMSTLEALSEGQGAFLALFLMIDIGKSRGASMGPPNQFDNAMKICKTQQQNFEKAFQAFRDHVLNSTKNPDCDGNLYNYSAFKRHNLFSYVVGDYAKWAKLTPEEEYALSYQDLNNNNQIQKLYQDTKLSCHLAD